MLLERMACEAENRMQCPTGWCLRASCHLPAQYPPETNVQVRQQRWMPPLATICGCTSGVIYMLASAWTQNSNAGLHVSQLWWTSGCLLQQWQNDASGSYPVLGNQDLGDATTPKHLLLCTKFLITMQDAPQLPRCGEGDVQAARTASEIWVHILELVILEKTSGYMQTGRLNGAGLLQAARRASTINCQ